MQPGLHQAWEAGRACFSFLLFSVWLQVVVSLALMPTESIQLAFQLLTLCMRYLVLLK